MNRLRIPGVALLGALSKEHKEILTEPALAFVAQVQRVFNPRRKALLARRDARQEEMHNGIFPNFLPETAAVRADLSWRGALPAPGMVDRRVEITGPVDRKMVINALNSGASTFMADFEDSSAPTWANNLSGQINLRDALRRTIALDVPGGKSYKLKTDKPLATLLVRPRGWHMEEKHLLVDGEPMSASLFDFSLYFFHNAHASVAAGQGPYFYLPKMESHLEARLWNDVFKMAQDTVGMKQGTIRATVLIETILASFEMDEILYELKEHSSGLNCGRWDYIFSYIKKLRNHPQFLLPDRSAIGMTSPFMDAYCRLLIKTCHQRGVHAMGGMAADIPIKNDQAANDVAMTKVRKDKEREVKAGHDGTWVAHPDLVKIAFEVFNKHMPQANQLDVQKTDVVTADQLLNVSTLGGAVTEKGLRDNISVGLAYMEAWLRGVGCVPINNLMEDAATAEISRTQVWQWARHNAKTQEGKAVTAEWVVQLLDEEMAAVQLKMGKDKFAASKFALARETLSGTIQGKGYADFLTTLCYDHLVKLEPASEP